MIWRFEESLIRQIGWREEAKRFFGFTDEQVAGVVQIEREYRGTAYYGHPDDAILVPSKMFCPDISSRIEQWDRYIGIGICNLDSIRFLEIAAGAS